MFRQGKIFLMIFNHSIKGYLFSCVIDLKLVKQNLKMKLLVSPKTKCASVISAPSQTWWCRSPTDLSFTYMTIAPDSQTTNMQVNHEHVHVIQHNSQPH